MAKKKQDVKQLALIAGLVVYNEEEALKKWLKEHPFFPAIIVIDQHSTDKTAEVAKSDPRVTYFKTNRFECIAEPDLNLLQKLAGENFLFIVSPDEYITEEHYLFTQDTVNLAHQNFEIGCFYISRKNITDGVDLFELFRTPQDPKGKDWQLRITLGMGIKFANTPHLAPQPMTTWAYIDSDKAWLSHIKTKESEIESVNKRKANISNTGRTRDFNHLNSVFKLLNKPK